MRYQKLYNNIINTTNIDPEKFILRPSYDMEQFLFFSLIKRLYKPSEQVRILQGIISQKAAILNLPRRTTVLITGQRFAVQRKSTLCLFPVHKSALYFTFFYLFSTSSVHPHGCTYPCLLNFNAQVFSFDHSCKWFSF